MAELNEKKRSVDYKEANIIFHDFESDHYDDKWAIRYDNDMQEFVLRKFRKLRKSDFKPGSKVLEIGCGTGYFMLNLAAAGKFDICYGCDISEGMVKKSADNAREMGIKADIRTADAENLPYEDGTFDIVIGHAVLHHLPSIERGLWEVFRVLKPNGYAVFAGEPSISGEIVSKAVKGLTSKGISLYAKAGGRLGKRSIRFRDYSKVEKDQVKELESIVDIHTFDPEKLCETAWNVGFRKVYYESEELLSSAIGWFFRVVEGTVSEENITDRWRWGAYRTFMRMKKVDELIYKVIPHRCFYNILICMEKA